MKTLSVVAAAVSLLLIVLTSPPDSQPSPSDSMEHAPAYWVNPDGARGLVSQTDDPPASPRSRYAWANPDGASGTEPDHPDRSPAKEYSWTNPDGVAGKAGGVHARADRAPTAF